MPILKVVRISPHGKLLATGGDDGHLRVWSFPDLAKVRSHLGLRTRWRSEEATNTLINIQGLKHLLWEKSDGTHLDELLLEDVAENAVQWIDM